MKAKMVYIVVALMMVFSLAPAIMMATPVMAQGTIYVDVNNGGCVVGSGQPDPYAVVYCNIQDAIDDAVSGDTIIVALGQYNEHDITINKSLVIQGAGEGSTFVNGQDISRVFYINQSIVHMSGMTILNGQITDDGGGIYNNMGNVTLTSCNISSNDAYFNGGGIYSNGGNLTLTDCTISSNEVTYDGGGIYNTNDGDMTLTNCTVNDNYSWWNGGGIYNDSKLEMSYCTVIDNDADFNGGGVYNNGSNVTITNCTISENMVGYDGGGIYNLGALNMTNCTISGNDSEEDGGGIYTGGHYQTITSSTPDDGSYSWSIPLSYDEYSSYKVKITDTSDSSCQDYSNSYFALYDGCDIHFTSPTGDENWELGSTHDITWTSQLTGGNVKIELYKGSSYYQTITSSTPDDGSYSWSIPLSYDEYSSYKVKITDTSDSSCQDYSNSYFALYDGCDIHFTSPTGDENWELGSTHDITWTSQLTGGNVKIELYKGSSYYQTITSSTPDDGSYSWSIPLSYDEYSSYKVKITDTSDSSCQDYSNSYFALYDGCDIHFTSPTGDENWELGSTHDITWTSQLTGGNVKIELYKGSSTLNMTNCTVSNNDADKEGGGIYNDDLNTLTLRCTIVYGNMAGDDGDDIMNLSIVDDPTDESIVGDAVGYTGGDPDPLLGPLQNNGGPTTTHALFSSSAAIDACINGCTVTADQRGYPRPIDGGYDGIANCDVGAYEYIPPPLPTPSPVPTLSQWGMIGMGIALAAFLVWSVRRRWVVSAGKS